MVCSLHSVTTGSRDRANVSLIIIIIHSMDFYLYLHVSEGVPVRKKDEILDSGRDSLYFPGLPLALLFYTRALIGRTDGA